MWVPENFSSLLLLPSMTLLALSGWLGRTGLILAPGVTSKAEGKPVSPLEDGCSGGSDLSLTHPSAVHCTWIPVGFTCTLKNKWAWTETTILKKKPTWFLMEIRFKSTFLLEYFTSAHSCIAGKIDLVGQISKPPKKGYKYGNSCGVLCSTW